MIGYSQKIELDDSKVTTWKLPCDIFKFKIEIRSTENAQKLIDFAKNIIQKNGCYFKHHYMHELINFWDILCSIGFEELYSWKDILKSVKIYNDLYFINKEDEANLFDKILVIEPDLKVNK